MNNIIDVAVHGGWNVTAGIVDTVIGNAVLRKIISADFLGTVARADKGLAGFGGRFHFLFFFCVLTNESAKYSWP